MTRRNRKHLRSSRGFTLLELILAMAMVTMLTVSLYACLNVAFKAKRAAERAVRPTRAISAAIELIGRDLESAVPDKETLLNPTGAATTTPATFFGPFYGTSDSMSTGESDTLEFYSLGSDGPWEARELTEGVRFIQFAVRTDVTPAVLVRRVTRNLLSTIEEEPEEEVICRGVRSFAVHYYDIENSTWLDEWDSTQLTGLLPAAVQIEIEIEVPGVTQVGQVPNTYRVTRFIPLSWSAT